MNTARDDGNTLSYESMGTAWEVTIWDDLATQQFESIKDEVIRRSHEFDHTYSRFIASSLVSELSKQSGVIEVPKDLLAMLRLYRALYIPSNKKLNPLIGFTISDLGYDSEYRLKEKNNVRPTPDFLETVHIIDDNHIMINQPVLFDFGALGKGYFVDRIAEYLQERGIKEFLVNGSGDIAYQKFGVPITAGLEDPEDHNRVIGTVTLTGKGALCASSGSRRRWGKYHHTIDPELLTSPGEIAATWVRAQSAALADALATCLFFVPAAQFQPAHEFEWCTMANGREVSSSPAFGVTFFT